MPETGAQLSRVPFGDLEVNVRSGGAGPSVVFVHGLAQDHTSWARCQDAMTDARTVSYDLRGHGGTTLGRADGTLAQLGDDLRRLLLSIEHPAVCVGHSLGGTIVLWLAAQHPELVRAVIASGTSSVMSKTGAQFYLDRIAMVEHGRQHELVERIAADTASMVWNDGAVDVEALAAHRARVVGDGAGYANAARAMAEMRQLPLQELLHRISCPVLFIMGEQDRLCPRRAVEIMREAVPHAEEAVIPNVGHLLTVEKPDAYSALVRDFVAKVER